MRVDGVIYLLEEAQGLSLEKYEKHDIDLVIDRVVLKEEERPRIAEAVELALLRGEGLLRVLYPDTGEEELFSEKFACPEHGSVLEELEPRIFSFNSPYGACPACSGLGYRQEFDPELVVNPELSLAEGPSSPGPGGGTRGGATSGTALGPWPSTWALTSRPPSRTCRRRRSAPSSTAFPSPLRWSSAGAARKPSGWRCGTRG